MTPLSIPEAVARRDTARQAHEIANTTHQLAVDHAAAADRRVAEIVKTEQQEAHEFVERIRSAAANGGEVERAKPSADAVARTAAEAEARSARAAVQVLVLERDDAATMLETAELDVQIATNAACNQQAAEILSVMEEAYHTLQQGAAHLQFLGRASFTLLPQPDGPHPPGSPGIQPLGLTISHRGQMLQRLVPDATMTLTQQQRQDRVGIWQHWRTALVDDPTTPSPWDLRE